MSSAQTANIPMPSISPEGRKKIQSAIKEISNSYARIEGERELIKETIEDLSEEYDIPKKMLNKIARTYHKQCFTLANEEHEVFEVLYTNIVVLSKTPNAGAAQIVEEPDDDLMEEFQD